MTMLFLKHKEKIVVERILYLASKHRSIFSCKKKKLLLLIEH